jgi:hypothetical protein
MSYTKTISRDTYHKWKCYNDWNNNYVVHHDSFKIFMLDQYGNYLHKVEWASLTDIDNDDRIFTFESEAHYTWFILQQ